MKKLSLFFATMGLVLMFNACTPDEVQPQTDQEKLEKFDVKSTDAEPSSKPKPGGA